MEEIYVDEGDIVSKEESKKKITQTIFNIWFTLIILLSAGKGMNVVFLSCGRGARVSRVSQQWQPYQQGQ